MKTKYPIFLVHGTLIKDAAHFKSFGNITNALRDAGFSVYVSHQDGVGTVENNAEQLKEEISKIILKEGCEKVNIIAHSKGGLDSRYYITRCGGYKKVASLTTLSTPHKGARLADKLLKMPRFCALFIAFWCDLVYKIFGDKKPDLLTLGKQLRVEAIQEFNALTPDMKEVFYQSFSAHTDGKGDFLMRLPHSVTKRLENCDTDGIVSVASSEWGEYRGDVSAKGASHIELVGLSGNKNKRKEISEFYLRIVLELSEKGL